MDKLDLLRRQPYDVRITLTVMLFYTIKSTNASLPITFDNVHFASMILNVDADEVWRIIAKQEQLSIDFSLNIGIYGICIISGKDWGVNR